MTMERNAMEMNDDHNDDGSWKCLWTTDVDMDRDMDWTWIPDLV